MRTSVRGGCGLGALIAAYLALAVVAGAPRSPLTVPLPTGARTPAWAAELARAARLDRVGRDGLIAIAWVLVVAMLLAFIAVVADARAGRVRLPAVLTAAVLSLGIAVAAPLLLSRDVFTYAAYGRIEALHHRNPYVVPLSTFPHDPFVALTPGQWLHGHSHYGPLFTLASAGIARTWPMSPGATILAFKLLAGLAIAAAAGLVAFAAARTRPDRAPLAAALVGLNPVLVVHTVGGGHVDALLAALLAAATVLTLTLRRAPVVTLLLTIGCLVKTVLAPALVLWLVHIGRTRRRALPAHLTLVATATLASALPYLAGWRTVRPFATLGGVEAWASPSHLAGHVAQALAGRPAGEAVEVALLVGFVLLLSRLARRGDGADPALWGIALLILALSMPYLLPWYAAWFAPSLGLLADEALTMLGALASGVLALTLIPADPFHGLTTPAVMDGVHYGAAPVLLVVLVATAARVIRATAPSTGSRSARRSTDPLTGRSMHNLERLPVDDRVGERRHA